MNAEPRVVFDRVWKKFRTGERHHSLRDLIPAITRSLVRRAPATSGLTRTDFWAVADISFRVAPGQALGIIGPNGAGKSTVLKLLTRIMRPTRGRSEVRGRVGALLEIGAGFHPDLTGRDNVYLQGTIMGMKRAEIARKFDEIVEFAGVADFIDTPAKRYSSGMNARLGFAIAAHMDPDVLIIDEILAVGDYAFQNRAFDRIRAVVGRGTPVVVVSHQLDRIATLCNEAILLDRGRVVRRGSPEDCIAQYVLGQPSIEVDRDAASPVHIKSIRLESATPIATGTYFRIRIGASVRDPESASTHSITTVVRSLSTGQMLFVSGSGVCGLSLAREGSVELVVELQANVQEGMYAIETHVWDLKLKRTTAGGPTLTVQVAPHESFEGTVNMNPRMELVPTGTSGGALVDVTRTGAGEGLAAVGR